MSGGLLAQLPDLTEESRAIANRAETRRLSQMGDLQNLRLRYEETMRWVNPPWSAWDGVADPRPDEATAFREGRPKIHVDLVSQVVDRWAALEAGVPFIFRCRPLYIAPPIDNPNDPQSTEVDRKTYEIDRQREQVRTSAIEEMTAAWQLDADFDRTWMWGAWSKELFGKAIFKTGWNPDEKRPTLELYENPGTVAYGWTKRYGDRRLAWVSVFNHYDVTEIGARFGIELPIDSAGNLDVNSWQGITAMSTDMDQRVEQSEQIDHMVTVEEYWELAGDGGSRYSFIIAGRVIETQVYRFLKRLPFHVSENVHVLTYQHGKSTAESAIAINKPYDDMLTRQHEVIEFESGPRYLGIGMKNAEEADIPGPFEMLPLDDGQMVQQLDTRVDFFPSELHAKQLIEEALTRATGLTAIAWGMSPNAQTSGRAMSAEWRAVELPLTNRLLNMIPVAREIFACWWDYAETYSASAKAIKRDGRQFEIIPVAFDIRDKTEKTLDIIQRLQAHIIDPESAIEESGYENVGEIMARIRRFLLDPVWNPLNVQQYLTLQQLAIEIRRAALEVAMMEQQAGQAAGPEAPTGPGTTPTAEAIAAQGVNAAGQAAQGPSGPVTEANNQPGTAPGGPDMQSGILLRTPLEGGIGNQTQVQLGGEGPASSAGQAPA